MSIPPRPLLLSALFVLLVTFGAVTVSAPLFHFYDGVSDPPPTFPSGGKSVAISNAEWAAQSFQASASYSLTRVAVWAQYVGNGSQDSIVEVRANAGIQPDMGSPPLGFNSGPGTPSYRWVNFTFGLPIPLQAGRIYWIVMRNASGVSSVGWNWWNTRADTYIVPGLGLLSLDQGMTWSPGGVGDFAVRTYGYEETNVSLATSVDRTEVAGGGSTFLTLWFNNTGTELAKQVWINVSLPPGMIYQSDNASTIGGSRAPGQSVWTFSNVGRGSRYFLVTASISADAKSGQLLIVRSTLTYTDFLGLSRPGSTSVLTLVVTLGLPPGPDPIVIGAVAFVVATIVVAFFRWRGGRVEEVFLVHWSGVLIVHLSRSIKSATDRDILAGMLTAIQQFVREAFVEWRGRDIRRIDFGNQKILMTRGEYSYLAVVLGGRKPVWLTSRMTRAISEFEEIFEGKLDEWDGALETLSGAEEMLSEAMFLGGFVRFSRSLTRILRPRGRDFPGPFAGSARERRRMQLSKQAGLRRIALRLRQRRELNDVDESLRTMVETALEEVSEGRFTVCGFANIYLATINYESAGQKDDRWWNAVLQLIRDVLRLWKWDPEGQAWVSEREEPSKGSRPGTDRRRFNLDAANPSPGPVLAPPVPAIERSLKTKDG